MPLQRPQPPNNTPTTRPSEPLTPLFGASILSSVGSLPLHLAPLIVTCLIVDSRASLAGAGWVPSAMLLGQLSTSLALPALKIYDIRRGTAIITALAFLIGLAVSRASDFYIMLLGWFLVGQCCGVLMYLGTMAASQFSRRTFAFALRLAIVLVLSGAIASLLQLSNALSSYPSLIVALMLVLVPILACGIVLHSPKRGGPRANEHAESGAWTFRQLSGLATVYVFFVGQTGFLAYVVQGALARGITFDGSVWSMVGMKFAAGIWLLGIAFFEFGMQRRDRFLYLGLALTFGITTVIVSRSVAVLFAGLVLFEITFNTLSARLQAAVVAARPEFAGPWLTGVILLGAATGPPLNGLAINGGLGGAFILVSILSALGPLLWQQFAHSGSGVGSK